MGGLTQEQVEELREGIDVDVSGDPSTLEGDEQVVASVGEDGAVDSGFVDDGTVTNENVDKDAAQTFEAQGDTFESTGAFDANGSDSSGSSGSSGDSDETHTTADVPDYPDGASGLVGSSDSSDSSGSSSGSGSSGSSSGDAVVSDVPGFPTVTQSDLNSDSSGGSSESDNEFRELSGLLSQTTTESSPNRAVLIAGALAVGYLLMSRSEGGGI